MCLGLLQHPTLPCMCGYCWADSLTPSWMLIPLSGGVTVSILRVGQGSQSRVMCHRVIAVSIHLPSTSCHNLHNFLVIQLLEGHSVHLLEGHTSTYFQLDPPWVPDIRSRSRTRLARVAHTSRHTSAPWGGAYHWFTAAIGCPPRLVGVPSTARSSSTISNCPPLSAASCRAWRAFAAPRGEMM